MGYESQLTNIVSVISGQAANFMPRTTAAKAFTQGTIYDNGTNVGLGTTAPQAKLEVDGTVYVNGNIGIGTVLPAGALDVQGNVKVTGDADLNGNSSISTSDNEITINLAN